ncbi:fluoride efflux transporter CrcB [Geodermatophilus sp. YIM 151500]|uniref:fluoride efflux transporter CrcB n=1 Tax=Geodermatophilus sp. YIM 151500 TaxID=2984531 RepID=UPI0021E46062|nr:fluoride efflux transporter CrcB [Geodermatophilus sp. YIM 151500]MCV2491992.1 fluoride efflux transporter CrcB [Geodermatophilus sp. YIM 151500]
MIGRRDGGAGTTVTYLLAALGGALGALARSAVAEALPRSSGGWPWATLAVNLGGCLLMGVLLAVLAARGRDSARTRAFFGTGVLGGFTTYSAFALETVDLARAGAPLTAAGYVLASVVGGVLAVAAGARLRAVPGGRAR